MKDHREKGLVSSKGGKSYMSDSFGAETFKQTSKKCKVKEFPTGTRGRGTSSRGTSGRGKGTGTKRKLFSRDPDSPSEDSLYLTSSSGEETDTLCDLCDCRIPPFTHKRRIRRKKSEVDWVQCGNCERWSHCECIDGSI